MLLIFVYWFLLLPLFINGCMRTPDIPGGPSVPVAPTVAPVTPDPCPIPPATAMIFILNDVQLVDGTFGMVAPAQSCATATGRNAWYTGENPVNPAGSTASAGSWAREACAAPCLCDAGGICYVPSDPNDATNTQDPALTLYPYCPTPTTCFIAVIMSTGGILTPNNGGMPINSDDQVDPDLFVPKDVTDPSYVKVKSIGCSGCPVVVA